MKFLYREMFPRMPQQSNVDMLYALNKEKENPVVRFRKAND
jgi:hypothetical protein